MERLIGFDPQLLQESILVGISVFVLFFALSYLLFNPVRDVLEKRKQKIADELLCAATDKKTAEQMKVQYIAKLQDVEKQAETILEAARRKARAREMEILAEAREEASRLVERANREIDLEKKKALDDIKQEVIHIAALMAGKAVAGSISIQAQDALFEEALKEMGDSTWQS